MRKLRDPELLEPLQQMPTRQLQSKLWRIARAGRDPLLATSPKGRWDDGSFDVVYTALDADTARAELHWHVTRGQPVFPSTLQLNLHELELRAESAIAFQSMSDLEPFGVVPHRFGSLDYAKLQEEYSVTQRIGEAAHFLGHDAIVVPSARWPGQNLVVLTGNLRGGAFLHVRNHGHQDLRKWAADHTIV